MSKYYFDASFSFVLGELDFTVDIDDSLSAEYRRQKYPEFPKKSLHYHPMLEIFFVFEDKISITLEDGCREVEGAVVFLPPNTKHFTHRSNDYRILISCEPRSRKRDDFFYFFSSILESDEVCTVSAATPIIKSYLEELCRAFYAESNNLTSDVIESLLKLILFNLYQSAEPSKIDNNQRKRSRYLTISSLISRSTETDVTLKTVADALSLSEKQASRIILKYYGKSLSRLINEEKLSYAKDLITSTRLPISEIALRCNFHSYKYFLRQFEDNVGCAPLVYRRKFKKD